MISKADIEKFIAAKFADTGWVEVPATWLGTSITQSSSRPLQYRKIGNIVILEGTLNTTIQRAANAGYNMATLGTGLRPVVNNYFPQVNGDYNPCGCSLETDGKLGWNNKTAILYANGSMLLHTCFFTD